jgi:hypothetical protein
MSRRLHAISEVDFAARLSVGFRLRCEAPANYYQPVFLTSHAWHFREI